MCALFNNLNIRDRHNISKDKYEVNEYFKIGVGKPFRTAERFQPGIILRTGLQKNNECLAKCKFSTIRKSSWH